MRAEEALIRADPAGVPLPAAGVSPDPVGPLFPGAVREAPAHPRARYGDARRNGSVLDSQIAGRVHPCPFPARLSRRGSHEHRW
ncbi:hypothetical protein C791_5009 [Amycolatopsis azurea DSM 43854]|uniref:Uncharacterized protein n=1 Tax=Amycolatopsis azurea DSM 43854 TaxID=1238180 RepID=M2P2B1_9PSEU|nr:hypothetical protein C791_5009 [Amycolatopsis azurea DSM 43854]